MPRQKRVALIIETYNEHARRLLRGIRAFSNHNEGWVLHFRGLDHDHDDLTWLDNWQGDGLIARITSDTIASFVRKAKLPTIDLESV